MKRTEIVLLLTGFIAMLLRLIDKYTGANILIILSMTGLASMYLFLGFWLFNNIRLRDILKSESYNQINTYSILVSIFSCFNLSLLVVGIYFKFMRWPGANLFLNIGLIASIPVWIVLLIKLFGKKSKFTSKLLIRTSVIMFWSVIMLFTSSETLLQLKWRNYPEVIEAERNQIKIDSQQNQRLEENETPTN